MNGSSRPSTVLITDISNPFGAQLSAVLRDQDTDVVDATSAFLRTSPTPLPGYHGLLGQLEELIQDADPANVVITHLQLHATSSRHLEHQSGSHRESGTHRGSAYEQNISSTLALLAALSAKGASLKRLVMLSSACIYGASPSLPTLIKETRQVSSDGAPPIQKSLIEANRLLLRFAKENPHVEIVELRIAEPLGPTVDTALMGQLREGKAPIVAGFDPQVQFAYEADVIDALVFALTCPVNGIFNVADPMITSWSAFVSKSHVTKFWLPPVFAAAFGRPLGLGPDEIDFLKFGRTLDTTQLSLAGFFLADKRDLSWLPNT